MTQKRSLIHIQPSESVADGDGVHIQRTVARKALHTFDPFLLLDEIASNDAADYIGGFPDHPHRGFETVTYMLEGTMKHRDHMGNEGLLVSGGVQWMTAGRGVIHSEMPQQESGRLRGFQLWINLPAGEKMVEPNYREYSPEQIPTVELGNNSHAKVIAGTFLADNEKIASPVKNVSTQPDYFDITLAAGETLNLPIDNKQRVLLYVYQGRISVNDGSDAKLIRQQQLGMLGTGHAIDISANGESRLLLLAGKPINEPIVNWGPFVMNTQEEIEQAIQDFRSGDLR